MAVRKRRAEGTPCNKENFLAWKERFEQEMEELRQVKEEEEGFGQQPGDRAGKKSLTKKRSELEDMENRLTGYEHFCNKLGLANLDALEQAAEEAEYEQGDDEEFNVDELDVDEELFDDEEDDLDDLDFDSDDDDESDDEEIDI